jgi:hypothetical protein
MQLFVDIPSLVAACGVGPGVEACAEQISESGAAYLICPTSDIAGVAGTPANVGTSPAIGTTGVPKDDYRVRTIITAAGVLGTSQVSVSLDGGNTYAASVATAATVVLGTTGLTLTMAAGSYVVGDTCSIDCTAPYFSTTNFGTAAAALLVDSREFGTLLVVGMPPGANDAAKATACASMAVAVGSSVATARLAGRSYRAVVDAPFVTAASMVTAFASFADSGVLVADSPIDLMSPISGLSHKRPCASTYGARVANITPQKHPGEVRLGPLPSRVRKSYLTAADTVTLDGARFVTMRTVPGRQGFFVTRGPTMAANGSDFSEHQFCRVSDLGAKIARDALTNWLNRDLDLKKDGTGTLTDVQAEAIDADITGALREALVNTKYVVAAFGAVNRLTNVLTTNSLVGSVRELRRGYAEFISYDVGFSRSA